MKKTIETHICPTPKFSMKEAKKTYYDKHNIGFFQRLKEGMLSSFENTIISVEGKGFWLSDIIMNNINKKFEDIQKIIINDSELKWTFVGRSRNLTTVYKTKKSLKEIKNKIKLPK